MDTCSGHAAACLALGLLHVAVAKFQCAVARTQRRRLGVSNSRFFVLLFCYFVILYTLRCTTLSFDTPPLPVASAPEVDSSRSALELPHSCADAAPSDAACTPVAVPAMTLHAAPPAREGQSVGHMYALGNTEEELIMENVGTAG